MTQSNSLETQADRWAGEKLWNVSLLPVSAARNAAAAPQPLAPLVALPLPPASQQERRRHAA